MSQHRRLPRISHIFLRLPDIFGNSQKISVNLRKFGETKVPKISHCTENFVEFSAKLSHKILYWKFFENLGKISEKLGYSRGAIGELDPSRHYGHV